MTTTKCKNCELEIDLYQSSISNKNGKKYFNYKKPTRQFCSIECASQYKVINESRICIYCNQNFMCKSHQSHKFCSQSCSSSFNKNCLKRDRSKKPVKKLKYFQCCDCYTSTDFKKRCNICNNIRRTKYEKTRTPKRRQKINQYTLDLKKKLVDLKGGCCKICGYNKSISALTFHHTDPTQKEFTLDRAHLYKKHIDKIMVEIDKCDLLCFNCHMELHHG